LGPPEALDVEEVAPQKDQCEEGEEVEHLHPHQLREGVERNDADTAGIQRTVGGLSSVGHGSFRSTVSWRKMRSRVVRGRPVRTSVAPPSASTSSRTLPRSS